MMPASCDTPGGDKCIALSVTPYLDSLLPHFSK
jgi:hypothetical protein